MPSKSHPPVIFVILSQLFIDNFRINKTAWQSTDLFGPIRFHLRTFVSAICVHSRLSLAFIRVLPILHDDTGWW